jgi:hypothetical protein
MDNAGHYLGQNYPDTTQFRITGTQTIEGSPHLSYILKQIFGFSQIFEL